MVGVLSRFIQLGDCCGGFSKHCGMRKQDWGDKHASVFEDIEHWGLWNAVLVVNGPETLLEDKVLCCVFSKFKFEGLTSGSGSSSLSELDWLSATGIYK